MNRLTGEDELIDHFTLTPDEQELLRGRSGAGRLAFSLLLKYLLWKGRFPRGPSELPEATVAFIAEQVGIPASELGFYDWDGRQSKRHRKEIRQVSGFHECTIADAGTLTAWLAEYVCHQERRAERVREELLERCRDQRIEPPAPGRAGRIIGSALRQADQALTQRIFHRIEATTGATLRTMVAEADDQSSTKGADSPQEVFAQIRSDPGNVSLKTCQKEVGKLTAIRAVSLPADLFAGISPKVLASWRARVAVETPSLLREHPEPVGVTLLAAYLHCREREITDTLADLLITTVHRINAHAQTRIVKEFAAELKRVSGMSLRSMKMIGRRCEASSALPGPVECLLGDLPASDDEGLIDQDPFAELGIEDLVAEHHQHLVEDLGDVGIAGVAGTGGILLAFFAWTGHVGVCRRCRLGRLLADRDAGSCS